LCWIILLVTMGALVIAVLSFAVPNCRAVPSSWSRQRRFRDGGTPKTEEALRQSHKMEAIGHFRAASPMTSTI
jgi:hypothetical protein